MKREKPILVSVDSVRIPIYRTPTGGRTRFTVTWREAGIRTRKILDDEAAARAHALDVATKLSSGQKRMLELTPADHESYVIATRELAPLGIPLHDAVRQFIAAVGALPPGSTLMEAAQSYAARKKVFATIAVKEAVEEYVAMIEGEKAKGHLSVRHVHTIRAHLRKFAGAHKTDLAKIEPGDVSGWLAKAKSRKTHNNLRTSLVTFFRYAKEKKYLPQDVETAAEQSKRKKLKDSNIGILTPDQLSTLLAAADEEARLYLALGAFTGIRSAELLRMTWEHVHFDRSVIYLGPEVTKTGGKRSIPILPNLVGWLAPFKDRSGQIFASKKAVERTIEFAKNKGVDWPQNALRHSFGSYRSAVTKSHPQVSLEMGNTVQMVKKHYDGVVSEEDAKAWFAIEPAK